MKIFPSEPTVTLYDDGFEDPDILQRATVGKSLSSLVERIEDPMVVALDGGWGTGKTYFLKRWVGAHTKDNGGKAKTVYFDAFAHDYLSDPLPALVSVLEKRFPKADKVTLKRVKDAAFKLAKPLTRIGISMATFGAMEALPAIGDAAAEAFSAEASRALENYWSQEEGRRIAIEEFRSALRDLVAPSTSEKCNNTPAGARLVIVVDELDRCRPDYALEVLEVIKHFFTIPGVTFVLGANFLALENSVKARYGAGIDASAYLRKFINVSLSLPSEIVQQLNTEDTILVYLDHQTSKMGIPDHIANSLRPHVKIVSRNNTISIRDIGKILSLVALLSDDILKQPKIRTGLIDVTIALIVSRVVRPDLYPKFLNAEIASSELEAYFDATLSRRSRNNKDEYVSQYDHYTWMQYNTWMYIAEQSRPPGEPADVVAKFLERFHQYGIHHDPRTIPKTAYSNFLDLF